jgi:predicted dehydrogenase
MSNNRLTTAVLGLKDQGLRLLATAAAMEYFDIVAVAEKEKDLARETAKQYDCRAFDDYRRLIVENQLDCILVAAGFYSCEQHLHAALKKKFNVFKLRPLSRNFEEAGEIVKLAEAQGIKLAVGVPARFSDAFARLKSALHESQIDQVSLVTVTCEYRDEHRPAWHADPKFAGGGVLLRDAYEIIDLIVELFGVPEQVYALFTGAAADRLQRHALTEDSALVIMKYPGDLCVNLVATRAQGPYAANETICCFGSDKVLTGSREKIRIDDRAGRKLKQNRFSYDPDVALSKALENFAMSILDPQQNPLICSGKEQLKNMAVIEAAYLSSRTAMPEQPRRILALEEAEPTLLWTV